MIEWKCRVCGKEIPKSCTICTACIGFPTQDEVQDGMRSMRIKERSKPKPVKKGLKIDLSF